MGAVPEGCEDGHEDGKCGMRCINAVHSRPPAKEE